MKKIFAIGCLALVVIGILVAVGVVFWAISLRNNFVTLEEQVNEKWSQVQNQYQRRMDLIPNLVETVKGYAAHENQTFENLAEARARAGSIQVTPEVLNDPQAFSRFQKAQGEISSALSRLLAISENYPDLKANQNFLQLQSQLEGTENRISTERMRFNEAARTFNVAVRRFPDSIVAGYSGFKTKTYFEAETGADRAPKVSFQ